MAVFHDDHALGQLISQYRFHGLSHGNRRFADSGQDYGAIGKRIVVSVDAQVILFPMK